ncbi:MAG: hypothetical protein A3H97_11290 [Acidobacteria bacterium RIFCSPLOWO2_02_FULL_65_29]|nr:MAG: hypothetical protein A3H97_11290 [Acidobacteria bacterium RIFCSPLOWO2_02_FULL_65_29]
MPDEIRSAYAVLGLRPGASLHRVRRQFKALVRRWHPDRFANDPQGKAEANDRLRVINNAYSTILQTGLRHAIPQAPRDPAYAREDPQRASAGQARDARSESRRATAGQARDDRPAADGAKAGQADSARAERGRATASDPTPPRPVAPLTREQIDALIDALQGRGRRQTLREQILNDPWNRGLSLAFVCAYMLVDIIQTWRHPWPRFAMRGIKPALPATGPVLASLIGSALWTLPLLWVIWYADAWSRRMAWVFLGLLAVLLPLFRLMMDL